MQPLWPPIEEQDSAGQPTTNPPLSARKDDGGKSRPDLLPASAMLEISEVLALGAKKYADYNYRGLAWSRLFGAALRHLWMWWEGEETDAEWGKSHLAHAACCVLMLMDVKRNGFGPDDRPLEGTRDGIGKAAECVSGQDSHMGEVEGLVG